MCAVPLSATESIFEFVVGNFAVFYVPQPISSSLMSRYVLNVKDSQCFQPSKK